MYQLRPYQNDCHAAILDALDDGYKSVLATAPTGSGKTVMFAELTSTFLRYHKWKVLILAARKELIRQAYTKLRDTLDLTDEIDIDVEQGENRFNPSARVVVGSRQTCYRESRLLGWTPDVIIVDEGHEALCASQKAIFDRFPNAFRIGFTATAMRGDKQPVFAEHIDGHFALVEDKVTRKPRPCNIEEAAFHKHVYDYQLKQAVEDGWLIEPHGYIKKSGLDISKVKTSSTSEASDIDFSQSELKAVLESSDQVIEDRINVAITKWKEIASDRPTLVFCPSVEYSKWAAELWRQAGYSAQSIDAKTDDIIRDSAIDNVHSGDVQVTCNFGIYTQGVDVDKWSCIVMLRPTKSPGLYQQMLGRCTRPLDEIARKLGLLGPIQERLDLIAQSCKPDAIVIDVVDICGKHKICTLPTTIGLPADLDLQGKGLMKSSELVERFEEHKEQVTHECPATYQELEACLQKIDLLNTSGAERGNWLISEDGSYYFAKAPVGYMARLTRLPGDKDIWQLRVCVTDTGELITDKNVERKNGEYRDYFESAAGRVKRAIEEYRKTLPVKSNWDRMTAKDRFFASVRGKVNKSQINRMTMEEVSALIGKQRRIYFLQTRVKTNGK